MRRVGVAVKARAREDLVRPPRPRRGPSSELRRRRRGYKRRELVHVGWMKAGWFQATKSWPNQDQQPVYRASPRRLLGISQRFGQQIRLASTQQTAGRSDTRLPTASTNRMRARASGVPTWLAGWMTTRGPRPCHGFGDESQGGPENDAVTVSVEDVWTGSGAKRGAKALRAHGARRWAGLPTVGPLPFDGLQISTAVARQWRVHWPRAGLCPLVAFFGRRRC